MEEDPKQKNAAIVPEQKKGMKTGAEEEEQLQSVNEAKQKFRESCTRLLNINQWEKYAGILSAEFRLTDGEGNLITREPAVGDLIRISLPAPGSKTGDGYDWVRIEAFQDTRNEKQDEEIFGFRVRPASNPQNRDSDKAHFFSEHATSSFVIHRTGNTVRAYEKGRNEIPNTKTDKTLDNVRNAVVGMSASMGMAVPQWKSLMNGILHPPEE